MIFNSLQKFQYTTHNKCSALSFFCCTRQKSINYEKISSSRSRLTALQRVCDGKNLYLLFIDSSPRSHLGFMLCELFCSLSATNSDRVIHFFVFNLFSIFTNTREKCGARIWFALEESGRPRAHTISHRPTRNRPRKLKITLGSIIKVLFIVRTIINLSKQASQPRYARAGPTIDDD